MSEEQIRTLTFLAPLTDARILDGEWRVRFLEPDATENCEVAALDFDDSNWERVHLPHLRHSTAERDRLCYRHRFSLDALPSNGRTLLRFGGAFYETRVWLNGVELGLHQGYFQSFGFDVTDLLRVGENVITVVCHFPVEAGRFKRKTAVAGIFTDWDCKPYPSTYYPNLPAPHEWTVPLGLWQPVYLQNTSDVLVESFNIFPTVNNPRWTDGADSAQVRVILQLRNLANVARNAHIAMQLAPYNFVGEPVAHGDCEIALDGDASRSVEFSLDVPQPRLWFPWTHGTPNLYRAKISLQCDDAAPREMVQVFGIRDIRATIDAEHWEWSLNGRRIFPKGSNYISDFYLDRVSVEGLSRDLALVRGANLDLMRVHAHIGSPEFYRLCDEQGVMVMCDFPLIWTYAFNLPLENEIPFWTSVLSQVEDMVGLLGSHPSIVLWSIHNEPPWTPDGSFLGADVHAAETNRNLDETAAERVRELDVTRPTIAASGHYDQHLYHGWYIGSWRDNRDLHPTFPTEFGVQALPNLDAPVWATINTNWTVDIDDPTWAHAGYQSIFWVSPGVGAPTQYASLAEYIQESQAYQAFYIRYTIDQWRRQKFSPVGGYIHFLFTDGWAAITWSVLDYSRRAKAGYRALAEVSRPAHICVDLDEGYAVEGAFHLTYPVGARFRAGLHLVNDDYRLSGRAQFAWWLEPKRGLLRRLWRRWFAPHIAVELPRADDGARLVQSVDIPLTRSGSYTFRTRLTQDGRVLDENQYELRVGTAQAERHAPRRVPSFLVGRVYEYNSLRHTADGFSFRLRNPAMPVLIQRLVELRVDGAPLNLAQVEIVRGGQSRRASTITPEAPLEFSSGEHVTVVSQQSFALGSHELEAVCQILGFGEIAARWHDRLV